MILTLFVPCPFGKWNLPKGDVDGTTIAARLKELLDDATVDPAVLRDMLPLHCGADCPHRG